MTAALNKAMVRIAYLMPSNRAAQNSGTANLQAALLYYQDWFRDQMQRNGIDMYYGAAHFVSPHTVEVASGHTITSLTGEKTVIAVGSVRRYGR